MSTEQQYLAEIASLNQRIRVLEAKNRGTLANNLCSDHRDKQAGQPCLACTIETLKRQLHESKTIADQRFIRKIATFAMNYTDKSVEVTIVSKPPDAGHPLLQRLVDSIDIVNDMACWDYSAMYAVRDELLELIALSSHSADHIASDNEVVFVNPTNPNPTLSNRTPRRR